MLQQLAFPFMFSRYDIHSDSYIPLTQEYLDTLEAVHQAYGRVREAVRTTPEAGWVSVSVLEVIHDNLRNSLARVPA